MLSATTLAPFAVSAAARLNPRLVISAAPAAVTEAPALEPRAATRQVTSLPSSSPNFI
jgi:hypothetical protein